MHNKSTCSEKLFMGKVSNLYQWYLIRDGVEHYATNSLLYITTMNEKYVECLKVYKSVKMYANMIQILSKGYLQISLLPLMKLQEILKKLKRLLRFLTQTMIML